MCRFDFPAAREKPMYYTNVDISAVVYLNVRKVCSNNKVTLTTFSSASYIYSIMYLKR